MLDLCCFGCRTCLISFFWCSDIRVVTFSQIWPLRAMRNHKDRIFPPQCHPPSSKLGHQAQCLFLPSQRRFLHFSCNSQQIWERDDLEVYCSIDRNKYISWNIFWLYFYTVWQRGLFFKFISCNRGNDRKINRLLMFCSWLALTLICSRESL